MKVSRFQMFTDTELKSVRQALESYKINYGNYECKTVSTSVMTRLIAEIEEELRISIPTLGEDDE